MTSQEILDAIKENVALIEQEIDATSEAAKKRCRSASTKIKQLAAEFKRTHK